VPNLTNIIKACIKGDRKAQKKLYLQFADRLYGVALRYAQNTDDAKDILQEGFIKIFNNLSQFKNEGSFEGWMRKVIVNTALERLRKQNRMWLMDEFTVLESTVYNYEHILEDLNEKELIKIVQELSPKYKMVFNLYVIEGYSHKEIADKLQISEGTSKSNLSRAKEILKEKVEKIYHIKKGKII
jgi:RNA polymerase sigma-70 factor (ECF subfamily)